MNGLGRALVLLLLPLGGCDLSMKAQPRHDPLRSAALWPDGPQVAAAPEGTVPTDAPRQVAEALTPPPADLALLQRGRERFEIYCAPCHGVEGRGDGPVVQRGFPKPPSYDEPRLRAAPAQHIVEVIANGYGVMYPYGDRVGPGDRWAVAAYVRALQLAHQPEAASP